MHLLGPVLVITITFLDILHGYHKHATWDNTGICIVNFFFAVMYIHMCVYTLRTQLTPSTTTRLELVKTKGNLVQLLMYQGQPGFHLYRNFIRGGNWAWQLHV